MSSFFNTELKIKSLTRRISSKAGRSHGQIVVKRRQFLNKRLYRFIDYKRIALPNTRALVLNKVYNSRQPLLLLGFIEGLFNHILSPSKAKQVIFNYVKTPSFAGDSAPLIHLPTGGLVHNISLRPLGVGRFIRSAGCSAILVRKEQNHSLLKLKSGELRYFNSYSTATLGSVGNETHFLRDLRKAGTKRLLGRRPRVRPSAMNPVDHPMGGRTKGGCQPMTPRGRMANNTSTKRYYNICTFITKRQLKFRRV